MRAPSRFLEAVVALARVAGAKILTIYQTDFRIGHKPDHTPLTVADLVSHHFLSEALAGLNGEFPVLSGLSALPPLEERRGWETYWLFDPLEGTAEFIRHTGEFSVNIALIHQNQPVLGIVYAPALQTCYFAAEGCGAFKQVGLAEPTAIQVRMQAPDRPLIVGSPSHTDRLDVYLSHLGAHDIQTGGGALAFCRVAEGGADLYPWLGPSSEWDTAAAQCIVVTAGGAVTDLHGKPLRYNAKPSLVNPFFLAFGDKTRDWQQPAQGIAGSPASAPTPPPPLLKAVIAVAVEAGARILDIYRSDFRIGRKADRSPFTAADLVSYHYLSERLAALEGRFPVLSEEFAPFPFEERSAWETYWLIDPLDGVCEFITRNGEFTVNIALIHANKPVLGVVYAPASQTCYFAAEGLGAYKQVGLDFAEAIHARQQIAQTPLALVSRTQRTQALDTYLERLGEHELMAMGSALKFCKIAEGEADVHPHIGPTYEWNTAAAQCIVEAAGGAVIDLDGKPLVYNAKPSLLNPYFLVFGDRSRDWQAPGAGLQPPQALIAA